MPLVLILAPFSAMALALIDKRFSAAELPMALATTTWPVAPVAFRAKARAVPSLLTVLVVVMMALAPLVITVASAPKVMA